MRGIVALGIVIVIALGIAVGLITTAEPTVVFEGSGDFGPVRVIERSDGLRELYMGEGRSRQSAVYPLRPEVLVLAYMQASMVGPALVAPSARVLFVGLGGGAMPSFVRRVLPELEVDAVELDPLIVQVANDWFALRPDPRLSIFVDDGRAHIEAADEETWDVVVLDAFSDTEVPRALTTREFLETLATRLTPEGVVVSNLHTTHPAYDEMVATYTAVYRTVLLVPIQGRAQEVLVASNRPGLSPTALAEAARGLQDRADLGFDLFEMVGRAREAAPSAGAAILEDQREPAGNTGLSR